MNAQSLKRRWSRFWVKRAGTGPLGKLAGWLAAWFYSPFYGRLPLARLTPKGFVEPSATVSHPDLRLGARCYLGSRVLVYQDKDGGPVELGDGVNLFRDIVIQTGKGGAVSVGDGTAIQPRCQISAYKGSVRIGQGVQIAPNCGFYPYDHGVLPGEPIGKQPLKSKGDIVIDDDAWLGFGVVVLDGVRIGKGAVVGAGSVVSKDVPDEAIALGVPARVVKRRSELAPAAASSQPS